MSTRSSRLTTNDLDTTVNQLIESCEGDPVAALRVLVVAYEYAQAELAALDAELAALAAAVAKGHGQAGWEPSASNAAGE